MILNPEAFEVKRLGKEDIPIARKLFLLFQDVFGYENRAAVDVSYLNRLLADPGFIVYAVMREDEVAGGLTAYELPMWYAACSEMFLYDIAVRTEFQRAGLGKMLLSALQEFCRQAGIKEMFVAANEEDLHALDFYQSTGGKAEKVVHFTYAEGH